MGTKNGSKKEVGVTLKTLDAQIETLKKMLKSLKTKIRKRYEQK